jgi:hypothetical protein
VRVCWEERQLPSGTRRVAFNEANVLTFNAKFLHELGQSKPGHTRQAKAYWFVVFCHELAHGSSRFHDKAHEAAEEALLQNFLVRFAERSLPGPS